MGSCGALRAGTPAGRRSAEAGFTLVELVVVLVVLGLLAAVAVPRWFDAGVFEERAWFDELGSALRYARVVAIGSGCPVRVTLTSTSYALHQQNAAAGHCDPADSAWPVTVVLVDGEPATGTAPAGVVQGPATTFVIDAAGRTSLAADLLVSVNTRTFTVHAGSGYVSP